MAHVFRGPIVFWALAYVFTGPQVLDLGSCFQRPKIFGSRLMFSENKGFFGLWLMFSKDQRFWILSLVFRGLGFLDLGSCYQRTKGFFGFSLCFQRTKGSGSLLMFSETLDFLILTYVFRGPKVFWAWAHVFKVLKVLDHGSSFQRPRIFGS